MATSNIASLRAIVLVLCNFSFEPSRPQDFWVADLSSSSLPGYPCKAASSLTAHSFFFTGLEAAGNVSNNIGAAVTSAFSAQFSAVNGIPLHNMLVVKGVICAGFISSSNIVYSKTLHKEDIMVFPRGLLRYEINVGKHKAIAFDSFSSPLSGLQIVPLHPFAGNLPPVIEKTELLS